MPPANILIYRNELLPLSETFILSQANALRRFTPVFAGLQHLRNSLDLRPHRALTLSANDSLRAKLRRRLFLRSGCSSSFIHNISRQSPQLVHAHFAIDAAAILPIVQKLRLPLIVTLHGYDVTLSEPSLHIWPTTRTYLRRKGDLMQYVDLFLCVSQHIRRQALACGFPAEKLYVHYTGVDLFCESPSSIQRDFNVILFVGRLIEKKGCIHLLHAMRQVQQKYSEAKLVIIGEGPLRSDLEAEAARSRINAIFLGHQPQNEVRHWMRRARLLVAPSIRAANGDAEGLPTVLCEALAAGLPTLAFATDGVTESFPSARRATLPREADIAGLADQMLQFLQDDDLWFHASGTGRVFAESNFNLYTQTCILEDKYAEVIARHRG